MKFLMIPEVGAAVVYSFKSDTRVHLFPDPAVAKAWLDKQAVSDQRRSSIVTVENGSLAYLDGTDDLCA